MRNKSKIIHERYHSKTRKSYKVISENNFTYRLLLETINKSVKKNATVLDIGCGAGAISLYMASKGHQVTGIDISEKAIKTCKDSAKFLDLKTKFLTVYFPQEKIRDHFDTIIFTEVIEHLEDDRKALMQIHEMLNKNGLLILSTPSESAPLHKLGLTNSFDKEVGHLRRYSLKKLTKLLEETGFKIKKTRKTEGIIRNFLFVNPIAGKFIRLIKFFISDWVTTLDNISLGLFGESNYIIVAKKVEKKKSRQK